MRFVKDDAEIYVPDGTLPEERALSRTTHLAIAAHQDDIEIMACHGILQCFGRKDQWFSGVVVTNGSGSPRDGLYAQYTDDEMQNIRKIEQKKSAYVGEYGAAVLLSYSSAEVKDASNKALVNEIKELIAVARPQIVYTHNLADKHDTHVAVAARVIRAIRELPAEYRPRKLYGCEVWRALDWVNDEEKVLFDVSAHPNISAAVLAVHDSQISGGKRYDLATDGRRLANATYSQSHSTDAAKAYTFAMDLTLLIQDDSADIAQFITGYIDRFRENVADKIKKLL